MEAFMKQLMKDRSKIIQDYKNDCMKTLVISFLLVFPFLVMAQQDTAQIKVIEPADSTGFGIPDGKQVSKELGSSGGRIASGDGKVELFFPIGALTTNTLISIQATTNPAPNGSGKAYQFEPSG